MTLTADIDQNNNLSNSGVHFETLYASRVLLRQMCPKDIAAFHSYRSDPNVARYQSWDSFTLSDAEKFVNEQSDRLANVYGEWIQLAVVEVETENLAGDCAFTSYVDEPRIACIGVTMSSGYQRRGFAFEALATLLEYLFVTLNKDSVVATVDVRNIASLALFRKLRFREESHLVENVFFKGEWSSEVQFAMPRSQWASQRLDV